MCKMQIICYVYHIPCNTHGLFMLLQFILLNWYQRFSMAVHLNISNLIYMRTNMWKCSCYTQWKKKKTLWVCAHLIPTDFNSFRSVPFDRCRRKIIINYCGEIFHDTRFNCNCYIVKIDRNVNFKIIGLRLQLHIINSVYCIAPYCRKTIDGAHNSCLFPEIFELFLHLQSFVWNRLLKTVYMGR